MTTVTDAAERGGMFQLHLPRAGGAATYEPEAMLGLHAVATIDQLAALLRSEGRRGADALAGHAGLLVAPPPSVRAVMTLGALHHERGYRLPDGRVVRLVMAVSVGGEGE
jgi:hypothetical protein